MHQELMLVAEASAGDIPMAAGGQMAQRPHPAAG